MGAQTLTRMSRALPSVSAGGAAWGIALLGALFYGWLTHLAVALPGTVFGSEIYDQLWLALREGRFDLPARVLRIEGHYAPDGTAYSYHGLAPLLTRAVLDPFVLVGTQSLAPVSIWFWSVLGTGFCHATVLRALRGRADLTGRAGMLRAALVSAFVWVGGAGTVTVASHTLQQEAIAVGYALFGAFAFFWFIAARGGRGGGAALLALALVAALCVHARPHLAVAMYAGTVGLAALSLLRGRMRALLPALAAIAVLGAGGLGYLALNEARFGSATATHGSFTAGQSQYGTTFWGLEDEDSDRARSFNEHGRFNAGRILPNALLYTFSPPEVTAPAVNAAARELHKSLTAPYFGLSRIESPDAGTLFLWTFWAIAAGAGLAGLRRADAAQIGLVAVTAMAALMILSYATISLRYHVELWPLLLALSLIGLPRLLAWAGDLTRGGPRRVLIFCVLGAVINVQTAGAYRAIFREEPGTAYAAWDAPTCMALAARKGFDENRSREICRDPRIETAD